MSQSKKHSVLESFTNTTAGIVTSFVVQLFLYPLLEIEVSLIENIQITIVFLVISIIRMYVLRRIFNKKTG